MWSYLTLPFNFPTFHHHTGWRTKCHTIDCARNTFLSLQKHLISGTELILIGWKIVPNEEHVTTVLPHNLLQTNPCIRHKSSESARHNFTVWALSCSTQWSCAARFLKTCVEKLWRMQGFVCKRLWGETVVTLNMFFIRNNFPAYED